MLGTRFVTSTWKEERLGGDEKDSFISELQLSMPGKLIQCTKFDLK